ncbi:MAG: Ig-like domain-containing protein, partial [Pseudomonadota bacterium]
DEVGNTGTDSTTGQIDTTAPSIALDAVATTNDTTPLLSGTTDAAPGSVVTLTVTDSAGNTQTITAVVQADGTFSAEVPADLAEGEFTVDASVTDTVGNTATDTTTGEIDLTAPTISIDAVAATNDTTPLLSGTTDATPGSVVTLTITDSAGNTQTITAVVQADGTFSAEVPADLAEGEFTVDASVTDEAGNTATDSIASVVDTTAPTITLSDPGSNGDATPTISGFTDAAPGSVVSFTVTDSAGNTQTFTALVNDDGTFSVEVPADVAPGAYDVTASVSDAAGNTVTATANGNYDTTAPSTTVNQPAPTNDTTPNISGETTAPAGSTVVIVVTDSEGNEQTFTTTVNADGSFDADIPAELAEGEYTVNVTVTDPSGNSSSNTVTGIIDTTPATLSLDAIGTTNDTTPLIQGETDAGAGATVTIQLVHSDGTVINLTATVQEDGSFSVEVPQELADGDFSVTATVSDQAGNTTSTSINAAINADGPNVVVQPQPVTDGDDVFNGSSDTPNSEVVVTITDSEGNSQTI